MFKKHKLCKIAITEYPGGYNFKAEGDTNHLLTAMLHGMARVIVDTEVSSTENAMALINIHKALRILLQEHGITAPTLMELAIMDEADFHFEQEGEGITDEEAMRIAEAVIENDSIWDEMYALMQDIHREI